MVVGIIFPPKIKVIPLIAPTERGGQLALGIGSRPRGQGALTMG